MRNPGLSQYKEQMKSISSYFLLQAMQTQLIDLLTQYVIPLIYTFMTRDASEDMAEMNLNIPSILSTVLDSSKDRQPIWTKLMECLMRYQEHYFLYILEAGSSHESDR